MDSLKTRKCPKEIVNFLTNFSCCPPCILRFLSVQVSEKDSPYSRSTEYLNELTSQEEPLNSENASEESLPKKKKPNICPTCLNSFEKTAVENFLKSFDSLDIESYDYETFFFNVSFPKCLAIRAHGMLLHLKEHFPEFQFGNLYEKPTVLDAKEDCFLEQPHKIFRAAATDLLSLKLNKKYHPKSQLSLLITLGYDNDNEEIQNMKSIIKMKTKKSNVVISRNNITEFLKDMEDDLFKKHFPVPPETPGDQVLLEKVDVTADPIYLGGRYLKFKRNVGQTPWIIDGVSVAEHNVQELIFDAINNVLRCKKDNMTFTASGREDVDVRMLGQGRPFYIKIDNPKRRNFTSEQLCEVEEQVIKSGLAAIIKLQIVYASEINRIKFGEEQKKKTYRALCKTTAPDIKEAISIINKQQTLTISQLTAMRVLHRRTLMAREKIIHRMSAVEVAGHNDLLELEIVTQAGTYVKEFVHGDFERTRPSISSLIGHFTDMLALDCIDIDLVWPENEVISIKNE